jgi:hypothetical protein
VNKRLSLSLLIALTGASLAAQAPSAPEPFRLNDWLMGPSAGERWRPWIKFSGRHRTRFESLDKQFRAGNRPVAEDQWFVRTSIRADIDFGEFGGTAEVMDSRAWGDNPNRQASTAFSNPADFVEANLIYNFEADHGHTSRLLAGRYTMALGSRRFVIRNGFRNTVNTFSGLDYLWKDDKGQQARVFWTMPVRRRPSDANALRGNEFEWDDQDRDLQFFGAFTSRNVSARAKVEAYVYGLREDAPDSTNRRLMTPGLRFHRPSKKGDWHGEVELTGQVGRSQASKSSTEDLNHRAWFGRVALGYRWDSQYDWVVQVAYDYASGDDDPNDGENNRFDSLYGAPRFEYCPTGLWGFVQRTNFMTPELRVSVRPTSRTWIMLSARDLRMASATDAWAKTGVRDPSGAAGDEVGQQYELRARYDILPKNMFLEIGGAYLVGGGFFEDAPNAPNGGDRKMGFVEMRWTF